MSFLSVICGISGLVLLYYGAEFLVKGGSSIALKMKISPLVIGLTLVAYATSAPELVSVEISLDEAKTILTFTEDSFVEVLKEATALRAKGIAVEMRKEG